MKIFHLTNFIIFRKLISIILKNFRKWFSINLHNTMTENKNLFSLKSTLTLYICKEDFPLSSFDYIFSMKTIQSKIQLRGIQ